MKPEEALRALRAGDFNGAVAALESVVRENGYSSDVVNHAYTMALHLAGQKTRLAEVSFDIGNLLVHRNPGLALDYFQRAVFSGLDPARVRRVCELHERWAAPPSRGPDRKIRTDRVAHVIGCLLPGHAPSLYIQLLSRAMRALGTRSTVFTTEWASSWFFNPPGQRQSQPYDLDAEVVVAAVDGDFVERAARIAAAIRNSDIDIALYHAGPTEQITMYVAAMHPTPIQLNVNHATEMDANLFDGFVHLFRNGLERTRFKHRPSRWIPLISDIEERFRACTPMTRQEVGAGDAETVSGTFGNLFKVSETGYLKALSTVLRRFPRHYHIFAGAGDPEPIRSFLAAEGVVDRVRLLGHLPDVAPLLDPIDLCLNSFPVSGGQSVLEPMAAGKPVVILRYPSASHFNAGAELAGIPELIADSEAGYIEIAERLIRSSDLRRHLGDRLCQRFQEQFRPETLGRGYMEFINEVIAQHTDRGNR